MESRYVDNVKQKKSKSKSLKYCVKRPLRILRKEWIRNEEGSLWNRHADVDIWSILRGIIKINVLDIIEHNGWATIIIEGRIDRNEIKKTKDDDKNHKK